MPVKRKTILLAVSGNSLAATDADTGQTAVDAGQQGEHCAVWLHADIPADWQDLSVRLQVIALDGRFDESEYPVQNAIDMPLRQGVTVPGRLTVLLKGSDAQGNVRKTADCKTLFISAAAQPGDPAGGLYPQVIRHLTGSGGASVTQTDDTTWNVDVSGTGGDMAKANYCNGSGEANLNKVDRSLYSDAAASAADGSELSRQIIDLQTKAGNPIAQIPANSIPSSLLRQAEDSDKIQMANLSANVLSAMSGTSPTGTTPADGSVVTSKVADEAISYGKLEKLLKYQADTHFSFSKEYCTLFSQALSGGSVSGDLITIPAGQTGNSTYISADFSLPAGGVLRGLLQGKTLGVLLGVDVSPGLLAQISSLSLTLNAMTDDGQYPANVYTSRALFGSGTRSYAFMTYTLPANVQKIRPIVQIGNSKGALASTETARLASVQVFALDSAYSTFKGALDTVLTRDYLTLFSDFTGLVAWFGASQSGAAVDLNARRITVAAGQTGNGSYIAAKYTDLDGKAGRTLRFKFITDLAGIDTGRIVMNVSVQKADGTWAYTQASNTSSSAAGASGYALTCDCKVTAGDVCLQPYLQLSNTSAFASPASAQVINAYYTLPDDDLQSHLNTIICDRVKPVQDGLISLTGGVTLTVKPDGSGDYTNPVAATAAIVDASALKPYTVRIYPGTYDVMTYLPSAMLDTPSSTVGNRGWEIPDYVSLVGVGGRDTVWLRGELPDSAADAQIEALSTVNLAGNASIENLKITAQNLRYAVHDESGNTVQSWSRSVKNCRIEHFGNRANAPWQWASAWGEGCSSGSASSFEDCAFIAHGPGGCGYGMHNNVGFTAPSSHRFKNCRFANLADYDAFRCGSMGSGVTDRLVIEGCAFTGRFDIREELDNGCGIDFDISGNANEAPLYTIGCSDGRQYTYDFADEGKVMVNTAASVIAKGTPVKLSGVSGVAPMAAADAQPLFYGVAWQDIPAGGSGMIKFAGYLSQGDCGLAAPAGSRVGVQNGALCIAAGQDAVGVADIGGYIRLYR